MFADDDEDPPNFEPFGHGKRWYDRYERRRRIGVVIVGIPVLLLLLIFALIHS